MKTGKHNCIMRLSELLPGQVSMEFGSSSKLAALLSLHIENSGDSGPLSICRRSNRQGRHVTLTNSENTFALTVEWNWDAVDASVYGRSELVKLTLTVKPAAPKSS